MRPPTDYFIETCRDLKVLCLGDPVQLSIWLEEKKTGKILSCIFWIIMGSGVYGVTIGLWRAPLQGAYVALKFPLLILLTTLGNGMLNGMFAQLLGLKLSFRQSFFAVILSFATASVILGSLAPISYFIVFCAPSMGSDSSQFAHVFIILTDVLIIAFAGTASNLHLFRLIRHIANDRNKTQQVIFGWLAVNLLLGGQLSWIMRPFIGSPLGEVEFFRSNALDGNFFEAVWSLIGTI